MAVGHQHFRQLPGAGANLHDHAAVWHAQCLDDIREHARVTQKVLAKRFARPRTTQSGGRHRSMVVAPRTSVEDIYLDERVAPARVPRRVREPEIDDRSLDRAACIEGGAETVAGHIEAR